MNPTPVPPSYRPPTRSQALVERDRIATELAYAIYRHRKGWAEMVAIKQGYKLKHTDPVKVDLKTESDRRFQLARGDVQWWRDEMIAHAAAMRALEPYINQPNPRPAGERTAGERWPHLFPPESNDWTAEPRPASHVTYSA